MLKDEKKAPFQYHQLLKKIKNPGDKRVIRGIIKQERKHFQLLKQIQRREK
jgi:rubrerythrin